MDNQNVQIGDIVVQGDYNPATQEEEFWVIHITGFDNGLPVGECFAICEVREFAELVGSLLKAYTIAGHKLPTVLDLIQKN
jgi:hypothetical protein